MKNFIIILISLIIPFLSYSQLNNHLSNEKCGTEVITKSLEKKYSEYKKQRSKVNKQTDHWLLKNSNMKKSIITIPVVVHIVWNTNQENISDAQIFSQINILNQDYKIIATNNGYK